MPREAVWAEANCPALARRSSDRVSALDAGHSAEKVGNSEATKKIEYKVIDFCNSPEASDSAETAPSAVLESPLEIVGNCDPGEPTDCRNRPVKNLPDGSIKFD
jgi:hypothetical protein